jgi:hypothetical protein
LTKRDGIIERERLSSYKFCKSQEKIQAKELSRETTPYRIIERIQGMTLMTDRPSPSKIIWLSFLSRAREAAT